MDFDRMGSDALEAALLGLRRQERRLEIKVLRGLIEVERRRLHLDRGFGSLFAYCVGRLGYCESSAGRRIAAARALRRCPRIEEMLLRGEVHVSTVALAAKEIRKDENVLDLIRGRTHREVEELLAARAGRTGWEFAFMAGPEFREKFERVRALMSGRHPEGLSREQVLEATMDEYLKRHDPARPGRSPAGSGNGAERSRYIPAAVQRAVWSRDEGRCTYVSPDGHRCGSTWDVELDHVDLYCRGGTHVVDNLRLLCGAHNRREAERKLGTAWMAPFRRRE